MQNGLRNKIYYLKNIYYQLRKVQNQQQNKEYIEREINIKKALFFEDFEKIYKEYKNTQPKKVRGNWQVEEKGLDTIYTYYCQKPVIKLKFRAGISLEDIAILEKERLLDPILKRIIYQKIHEVSFSNPQKLRENLYYLTSFDSLLNLLTNGVSSIELSVNDLLLLSYIATRIHEKKYSRLNMLEFRKIIACLFDCKLDEVEYLCLGGTKAKVFVGSLAILDYLREKEYMPEIVLGDLYFHNMGKSIDEFVCPKIVCGNVTIKQEWIEHLVLPEISLGFIDIERSRYLKKVELPRLLFDGIRFQELREISRNYPLIFPSIIWGGMYFPSLNSKENMVMPQINYGEFQLREKYVCYEENWEEVQKKEKNCTLKELENKILIHELSKKRDRSRDKNV